MYIKFGFTGTEVYRDLDNLVHYAHPGYLKLVIGKDGIYRPAIGYFYGVTFGLNQGLHKENKQEFVDYFNKQG